MRLAAPRWHDHLTPTAAGLVSRAWVMREVMQVPALDNVERLQLIDALVGYEPPRAHGLRNNFIGWVLMLGGAMVADAAGIAPGWGFATGVLVVLLLARKLATRALRWRLQQWLAGERD